MKRMYAVLAAALFATIALLYLAGSLLVAFGNRWPEASLVIVGVITGCVIFALWKLQSPRLAAQNEQPKRL